MTHTSRSHQITNSRTKLETALEYSSRIEWAVIAIPNPIKGIDWNIKIIPIVGIAIILAKILEA